MVSEVSSSASSVVLVSKYMAIFEGSMIFPDVKFMFHNLSKLLLYI